MTTSVLTEPDGTPTDAWTDLGGVTPLNPDCPGHRLCNGDGWTRATDDHGYRLPVACPLCRPVAARHAGPRRRRERVLMT